MAAAPSVIDQSPTRVSTFESLRVRNFRLFFGGQLISQIGNWLTLIAQALLVLKLTDSGFALGLLAACQFGPVLVLGAWSGLVADRSDKRKLLLIVQTFAMVQSFALAFIAFMDNPPVAAIYVVACSAAWRRLSTTLRAVRMWSRWCPRPTCRMPSASTAR